MRSAPFESTAGVPKTNGVPATRTCVPGWIARVAPAGIVISPVTLMIPLQFVVPAGSVPLTFVGTVPPSELSAFVALSPPRLAVRVKLPGSVAVKISLQSQIESHIRAADIVLMDLDRDGVESVVQQVQRHGEIGGRIFARGRGVGLGVLGQRCARPTDRALCDRSRCH